MGTKMKSFCDLFSNYFEPFWKLFPYIALAIYSIFLAINLAPNILGDDAAITFRYVERIIIDGRGFTYNDHEHVQGASSPLYTLILAAIHYFGVDIENAAFAMGLVLFIASVLLAFYLASNISNQWGGLLAGFALASDGFYRYQALSGMESVLSVVLGLLTVSAILKNRPVLTGIFLGLAIWNKLDAGLLALAVGIVWLFVYRKFPYKIACISLLVVLPWFLFAEYYYGSIIPNSMIAKMHHEIGKNFNYYWILEFIENDFRFLYLALAASLTFSIKKLNLLSTQRGSVHSAIFILMGWFVLHGVVFSVLNLGGNYPWYLTVLIPPLIILASSGVFSVYKTFENKKIPYWLLIFGLLLTFAIPSMKIFETSTLNELKVGNSIKSFEVFDNDRRLAGIFLDQYASKQEVVDSGYGWVAFESRMPFNDRTNLNSRDILEPASYAVDHGNPHQVGSNAPIIPKGYIPLATFNLASDMFHGHSWFTVFGLPESTIAQSGIRYLQYRLNDIPVPVGFSNTYGLENIKIHDQFMDAHPPSGAVFTVENDNLPVNLVFTPTFNPETPKNKTDGVTFKVIVDGKTIWNKHIKPTDLELPVILPVKSDAKMIKIAFVTEPGPANDFGYDWVAWKNVKFIIGNGLIDEQRIKNSKLKEMWCTYNLCNSKGKFK